MPKRKTIMSGDDGLRPFAEGEFVDNADGTRSTERTVTIRVGNEEVVIPSLWMGPNGPVDLLDNPRMNANTALQYEKRSGKKFPRFKSVEEANNFARQRSERGAAFSGPLAR